MKTILEYLQSGHLTVLKDKKLIHLYVKKNRPKDDVMDEYVGIETSPNADIKLYIKFTDLIQFNRDDILNYVDKLCSASERVLFTIPDIIWGNKHVFSTAIIYTVKTGAIKESTSSQRGKLYNDVKNYFLGNNPIN